MGKLSIHKLIGMTKETSIHQIIPAHLQNVIDKGSIDHRAAYIQSSTVLVKQTIPQKQKHMKIQNQHPHLHQCYFPEKSIQISIFI
jgi:hypothetical protein